MVLFINNSYIFYFYHIEKGNFMELKQLEYFRAIVDAGTISGAARDLHMTQPPLSYQIKMLEEELQVPLFLRGKKRITLTEAGKTLYEQAGNLLMLSDLAKREVIKSSQSATLHIGMTPSTVSMMSDHLLHFAKKYPKVRFDVHEGSTFTLKDQLENRIIDLTTLRTPIALNGCETKPLKELSRQPLILSYRYRKYMLAAFERAGLMCDIYFTCGDARTAMTMAEKGLGIAILPASMQTLSSKLTSCRISGADLTTEILLAWRKEQLPEEIQDFLKMWD